MGLLSRALSGMLERLLLIVVRCIFQNYFEPYLEGSSASTSQTSFSLARTKTLQLPSKNPTNHLQTPGFCKKTCFFLLLQANLYSLFWFSWGLIQNPKGWRFLGLQHPQVRLRCGYAGGRQRGGGSGSLRPVGWLSSLVWGGFFLGCFFFVSVCWMFRTVCLLFFISSFSLVCFYTFCLLWFACVFFFAKGVFP